MTFSKNLSESIYVGEKEGEKLLAKRKNCIDDAEKLGLEPIYEAKSGKNSTMDQTLDSFNRVYELAIRHEKGVCHNQAVQCEQPPSIHIRHFTAEENEGMKQVAYTLNKFNELSQISGESMFVDNREVQ